jgi:hypothetical protein
MNNYQIAIQHPGLTGVFSLFLRMVGGAGKHVRTIIDRSSRVWTSISQYYQNCAKILLDFPSLILKWAE